MRVTVPGMDPAFVIQNLIHRYAECVDAGDFEGLGGLFAHGRIVPRPGAGSDEHVVGAEAVRTMYASVVRRHDEGRPRTHHVTTNLIVDVDDGAATATARSYYTVLQQTDSLALQPIICGRYHDTFHVVDGEWSFATRTMFVDLVGDLSHHLTIEL